MNAEQLLEKNILTQLANDIENKFSYKSGNEKRIEDNRAKGNWDQAIHARSVNDSSVEIKKHQMNSAPKVSISKTVHSYTSCSRLNPYIKRIVSSVKPPSKKEYSPPRIPNIWSSDEWANFKKSIPINNYIIPQHHFYNDQILFDLAYDHYEKKITCLLQSHNHRPYEFCIIFTIPSCSLCSWILPFHTV